jgi:hypothetical protein
VGIRELRKLAEAAGLSVERATLVLELAAAAGLVVRHRPPAAGDGEVLPTEAYDDWNDLSVDQRWLELATAWTATPSFLALAGATDSSGKVRPALYDWGPLPMAVTHRRRVLAVLADLDPGVAPTRQSLLATVTWEAPAALALGPADAQRHVAWVLAEADLLGLVHADALSVLGRHLVTGEPAAAAALVAQHLEEVVPEVLLQADLTAIVPSMTAPTWRAQLEAMADVESKGAAIVYRFSEASVRRALDGGRSASELLAFLEVHAAKGVPQPLVYLVEDVARRHGRTRVGAVASYVRFEDEAAATETLRSRKTAGLGLRRIAPAVLVSDAPLARVLAALRAAGEFPVQEDATGAPVVASGTRRRAPGPHPGRRAGLGAPPWSGQGGTGAGGPAAWRDAARHLLESGAEPETAAVPGRPPLHVVRVGDSRRMGGGRLSPARGPSEGRPEEIGSDPDTVWEIAQRAFEHDWMVRVAVRDRRRRTPAIFDAMVTGLDDEGVQLFSFEIDAYDDLDVPLRQIAWIRVLTAEEEEMP